jgi:hypothetical protein
MVRVTAGEHPDYGRLVLNAPGLPYSVNRDGGHILIRFSDDAIVADLPPAPRNVLAIRSVPGGVELTVPPAADVHISRIGDKIVVDVADTVPNRPPVPPARAHPPEALAQPSEKKPDPSQPPPTRVIVDPAPGDPVPRAPVSAANPGHTTATDRPPTLEASISTNPGSNQTIVPQKTQPQAPQPDGPPDVTSPSQPAPIPISPVSLDAIPTGPVALVASRVRPPDGLAGIAVQIPFAAPVGAALFSRGPDSYVVFDERRPIDLAALRDDPVFGSAAVTIYPGATVFHMIRPAGRSALLSATQAGWRVSIVPALPRPVALTPVVADGTITFAAEAPGQVVAIADPQTGATILVGTQRGPGRGILIERRTPEFVLPLTGQGIVVIPLSDGVGLRIAQAGFVLYGASAELVLSPPQPMDAATMAAAGLTRLFEFPRQSTATLAWRARQQAIAAATSSPLTRGPKRHALAESLVGLGLGVEARTLLQVTMKDDPIEAASPTTIGLAAIAALLADRPGEAGDLADPRLTGADEIALWRAIQTAMSDEGSSGAAAVFATTAPLVLTYPAEMRWRVLPLVLETMVLGGQADAAAPLLAQMGDDPRLAYARALLKQAQGDNAGALKLYDDLANSRSTLDHARGAMRATELRLAMGELDAKGRRGCAGRSALCLAR